MKTVTAAMIRCPADAPGHLEPSMSARIEDLKFLLTLSAVVLLGSGLDVILR